MDWRKRVGQGLMRPVRWLWGRLRMVGARVASWWRGLGTGVKGALARLAALGVAAALIWGLVVGAAALSGALTARGPAGDGPLGEAETGLAAAETERAAAGPGTPENAGTAGEAGAPSARDPIAAAQSLLPPAPSVDAEREALPWAPLALPVSGTLQEPSGWRRHVEHGYWYYEPGVELSASEPTVYAVLPGQVARVAAAASPYSGHTVVIDHGDGLFTEYKPLQAVYVAPGQYVSARAPIGESAGTVVFAMYLDGEPLDAEAALARR